MIKEHKLLTQFLGNPDFMIALGNISVDVVVETLMKQNVLALYCLKILYMRKVYSKWVPGV